MNRRMVVRSLVFAGLAFASAVTRSETTQKGFQDVLPGCPWRNVTVRRQADEWVVEGPGRRRIMSVVTEPTHGGHEKYLTVKADAEGLVVDAAEAYRRGAVRVVMRAPMAWKRLVGEDCQFVTRWSGEKGVTLRTQVEGADRNGVHWWRDAFFETDGKELECRQAHLVPGDMRELHWRLDIQRPGAHPVRFLGGRAARWGTFYQERPRARQKPELLFRADFDGTAEATFARGQAHPSVQRGLAYAPGRRDRAVRFAAEAKPLLAYELADNVLPERGTAVAWVRRERRDCDKPHDRTFEPLRQMRHRMLLHLPAVPDGPGRGTFAWQFEWTGLRCGRGDVRRRDAVAFDRPWWGEWEFVAVTWDDCCTKLYHNGVPPYGHHSELSPMHTALKPDRPLQFADAVGPFERLFVGMRADGELALNGLMDDLRIWSAPLSPDEIRDLYEKERDAVITTDEGYGTAGESRTLALAVASPLGVDLSQARCVLEDVEGRERASVGADALRMPLPGLEAGTYRLTVKAGTAQMGSQPYVVLPHGGKRSGEDAGELVERIDLGRRRPGPDRFRSTGKEFTGVCDGVPYLCAGTNRGDRLAVRFRLDRRVPLYWVEVDYPDDALRTADFLVQPSADPQGYEIQVGYATGGAFPTSGRIRTMRLPLWQRSDDVSAVLMTIRRGEPAAVSEIRLYKSASGRLPDAAVRPAPAVDGTQRHVGLYFEDPAIGYDFAQDQMTPDGFAEQIERLVAWLKMSGQDLLAYPGVWYHGRIAEDYQPRPHPPRFLQGYAERFDHEGFSLFPTLNLQALWMPEGLVTRTAMSDGSLHPTSVAIHDTGRASWANWHDQPPNFNVAHRALQEEVFGQVDALAGELKGHKSFKGVCLHLTSITCTWWGGLENGYNDYCIDGFEKATGIRVPVDRRDPLRARGYAAWLKANALNRWLDWRCDVVTRFFAEIDARLKARRADLRLWVNAEPTALFATCPDILEPEVVSKRLREYGFDARKLAAAIPDALLGVTAEPMGWRHHIADRAGTSEAKLRVRDLPAERDFYRTFEVSSYPILNLHDSYFECPTDALRDQISGDWLKECPWRVTVLNPPGRQVLRNYLLPLRFGDMLGVVRGGFLMGGYGAEKATASFARSFRALPAVRMNDVASQDMVRVRQVDCQDRSWFYVVNADARETRVRLRFPKDTTDLSTGERMPVGPVALDLEPWDFRSYAAPSGRPELFATGTSTWREAEDGKGK